MKERKKVSMRQIAEQLSVSLGTVSLVLNGRGDEMRISAETQKLILDTAKNWGTHYESRWHGKKIIAIFLSVYEKVMIPVNPIMIGAEKEIQAEGLTYDLVLCPFTYDRH